MRIVILGPSLYSETTCAMAARMAAVGYVPCGALVLSTLDLATLRRKLGQWGARGVVRYASKKLIPHLGDGEGPAHNPHLQPLLKHGKRAFRNLREVAVAHDFPVTVCGSKNSRDSIAHVREWSPDLIISTGGEILRKPLLQVPRLGVLNVHLGLLPEIRGMSSPEWSLLNNIPVGITIHFMDEGIDTGPILQRCKFPEVGRCELLSDLRNRLIAFGVERMAEVVAGLDRSTISAVPQSDRDKDNQFFVMHEWLQARAAEHLAKYRVAEAGIGNR